MSFVVQPPVLPCPDAHESPVFLDERGRRASAVRVLGILGAVIAAAALLTIVMAATSFSRLSPLSLPHAEGAGSRPALVAHGDVPSRPRLEDARRQAAIAMLGGMRHGPAGNQPAGNQRTPGAATRGPARVVLARLATATAAGE